MNKRFKLSILAALAAVIIRCLRFTWRVRIGYDVTLPETKRLVFCFWHGNQAALFSLRRPVPVAVLASLSTDGTLQTGILKRLGYTVCRGSSSRRGANGLRQMIRRILSGCDAAFAVDGPRGPYHRAKGGAIIAARCTGAMVVPVVSVADNAWVFGNAWDAYTLPKPFSRITIQFGEPREATDIDAEILTSMIQSIHSRLVVSRSRRWNDRNQY